MKAVIVDLQGRYAAALMEDGTVRKIPNEEYEIGQSVNLYETKLLKKPSVVKQFMKQAGSVAAAAVVITTIGTVSAYAIPYGTVSMDVNPAISYTINCFDYVLDVEALNEEGAEVLAEIDMKQLCHQKVGRAVVKTLEQMETDGYLEDIDSEVTILTETKSNKHTERLQTDLEMTVDRDMERSRSRDTAPAEETEQKTKSSGAREGSPEEIPGEQGKTVIPEGEREEAEIRSGGTRAPESAEKPETEGATERNEPAEGDKPSLPYSPCPGDPQEGRDGMPPAPPEAPLAGDE